MVKDGGITVLKRAEMVLDENGHRVVGTGCVATDGGAAWNCGRLQIRLGDTSAMTGIRPPSGLGTRNGKCGP